MHLPDREPYHLRAPGGSLGASTRGRERSSHRPGGPRPWNASEARLRGSGAELVLDGWTHTLVNELDAVRLAELERGPTTYRVFLLPDALQLDPSMTPAAQFRPVGPRFRLLFGNTAADESEAPTPPVAGDLFLPTPAIPADIFGWGVIYALHARACVERGRIWQAEHYVGAVRDHALSLACLRQGLPAAQARSYDDLAVETLARFEHSHVGAVEPGALRAALAVSVLALMREGAEAHVPHARVVAERLDELR